MAIGADLFKFSLDEDPSNGLIAFFCASLKALVLLLAFSSVFSAGICGIPIHGCLLVLRYKSPLSGLELLISERVSYFDTCIMNDSKLCLKY